MADVQIVAKFPLAPSPIDRDWAENVFWIKGFLGQSIEDIATEWTSRIEQFYNDANEPDDPLAQFMGAIVRDECVFEIREAFIASGTTGPLLAEIDWTLAGLVGAPENLPNEVSLVTTLESDDQGPTTTSRARRRGRLYIGPLNTNAAGSGVTGQETSTPGGAFISSLAAASSALAAGNLISGTGQWCIYSRAGAALSVINHGYVDNEWDTQRRRGRDATGRTLWTD